MFLSFLLRLPSHHLPPTVTVPAAACPAAYGLQGESVMSHLSASIGQDDDPINFTHVVVAR